MKTLCRFSANCRCNSGTSSSIYRHLSQATKLHSLRNQRLNRYYADGSTALNMAAGPIQYQAKYLGDGGKKEAPSIYN